jgi:hypothetical protein
VRADLFLGALRRVSDDQEVAAVGDLLKTAACHCLDDCPADSILGHRGKRCRSLDPGEGPKRGEVDPTVVVDLDLEGESRRRDKENEQDAQPGRAFHDGLLSDPRP